MSVDFPPSLIFLFGALVAPLLKGKLKQGWLLLLPLLALGVIHNTPLGDHWTFSFLGMDIILGRIDRLSRVFGYIFSLISFIGMIFALKVDDDLQWSMALAYAGGALGVTFAGDFFSLYVFWEIMAVSSTFLVLARRTRESRAAAFRYIMVHLAGGLLLLAGILLRYQAEGTLEVGHIELGGASSWLIFLGIAVNAAIPPLHGWLKDAYPQGTAAGSVFLSAFTTKSAVYLMARTFAGAEPLIWLGAIMTFFPIFYAVLENDVRGVLSYSLINQVGFMLCGVGIGTELALNGTVSHAFCHILYKALLFMAAGSVMTVTGRTRCTDLGGLYKTMPLTCLFCCVGAASISAFPLFSGFVSKSMIVSAAGHERLIAIWLMLQFASAGVFHHAGIKVPYFVFFSHDAKIEAKEPPPHMLTAMGLAAGLCVLIGVYPEPLYNILPYPVDYTPYTAAHVMGQLQLLMFGALAFTLLLLSGTYPAEMRAENLDADWFYRRGGLWIYNFSDRFFNGLLAWADRRLVKGPANSSASFFKDAPVRLSTSLLLPFYRLFGYKEKFLELKINDLRRYIENASVPVGITGAAAVSLLAVVLAILFQF